MRLVEHGALVGRCDRHGARAAAFRPRAFKRDVVAAIRVARLELDGLLASQTEHLLNQERMVLDEHFLSELMMREFVAGAACHELGSFEIRRKNDAKGEQRDRYQPV